MIVLRLFESLLHNGSNARNFSSASKMLNLKMLPALKKSTAPQVTKIPKFPENIQIMASTALNDSRAAFYVQS